MRNGVLKCVDKVKRGRGRPKLTWDESVKRDLKDWNISEEVALDKSAWRLAINVSVPWPLCLLGFITSLPNSLGTKDYVVVVVVGTLFIAVVLLFLFIILSIHLFFSFPHPY